MRRVLPLAPGPLSGGSNQLPIVAFAHGLDCGRLTQLPNDAVADGGDDGEDVIDLQMNWAVKAMDAVIQCREICL
jgi:hypothetical protein